MTVIKLIKELMRKWKTRLEIWREGEKILCGFLQGDSYSPDGFYISEILVCALLQHSRGYRMGERSNRIVKRTHSLFVDDLKVYQEYHNVIKNVSEIIVQASHDTRACLECQSVWKSYSNMTRWWEKKFFRCWGKEWRPWTQMKTKSINFWELNRLIVSERKQCLKEWRKRYRRGWKW